VAQALRQEMATATFDEPASSFALARAAIAAMREPLEQAKMSIIAASIGSCDCNTKSPDPVHHLAYCRWLKLMVALDCIDAALSEGKSDD